MAVYSPQQWMSSEHNVYIQIDFIMKIVKLYEVRAYSTSFKRSLSTSGRIQACAVKQCV